MSRILLHEEPASGWTGAYAFAFERNRWFMIVWEGRRWVKVLEADDRSSIEAAAAEFAGNRIASFLPQKEFLTAIWSERLEVRRIGAEFDHEWNAWFVPDELKSDALNDPFHRWRPPYWDAVLEWNRVRMDEMAGTAGVKDRIYLNAGYASRAIIKARGARYEPRLRKWFIHREGPCYGLSRWLPEGFEEKCRWTVPDDERFLKYPRVIAVPKDEGVLAQKAGAVKNEETGVWYAPAGMLESSIWRWNEIAEYPTAAISFREPKPE